METFWYIKGLKVFQFLEPEHLAILSRVAHEETYPHHEPLPATREGQRFLYLIVEGRLKLVRRRPDEEEEALVVLDPGDVFGEMKQLSPNPDTFAESMDETTVSVIPYNPWINLLRRHREVALCSRRWWGHGRARFQISLAELSGRSVTARLALVLLELTAAYQDWGKCSGPLRIRLTTAHLSALVGAPDYIVAERLKGFEQAEILRIHRRRFYVLNPWGLKKWSRLHDREIEVVPEPVTQEDMFSSVLDQSAPGIQ